VDLEDEDVVGVVVDPQPARRRRGQVGVDLHRVGQEQLQVAAEGGQRRPEALQALEHDGGPGGELAEDLPGSARSDRGTEPIRPDLV
jgi:hypothetical protein